MWWISIQSIRKSSRETFKSARSVGIQGKETERIYLSGNLSANRHHGSNAIALNKRIVNLRHRQFERTIAEQLPLTFIRCRSFSRKSRHIIRDTISIRIAYQCTANKVLLKVSVSIRRAR